MLHHAQVVEDVGLPDGIADRLPIRQRFLVGVLGRGIFAHLLVDHAHVHLDAGHVAFHVVLLADVDGLLVVIQRIGKFAGQQQVDALDAQRFGIQVRERRFVAREFQRFVGVRHGFFVAAQHAQHGRAADERIRQAFGFAVCAQQFHGFIQQLAAFLDAALVGGHAGLHGQDGRVVHDNVVRQRVQPFGQPVELAARDEGRAGFFDQLDNGFGIGQLGIDLEDAFPVFAVGEILGQFFLDGAGVFGTFLINRALQKIAEQVVVAHPTVFIVHRQHEQVMLDDVVDQVAPVLFLLQCLADDLFAHGGVELFQDGGVQHEIAHGLRLLVQHLLGKVFVQADTGGARHLDLVAHAALQHLRGEQQAGDPAFCARGQRQRLFGVDGLVEDLIEQLLDLVWQESQLFDG